MTNSDLRPLSLGEILDRTFSLYRQHFVLFVGIAALPQLLNFALSLAQMWIPRTSIGHAPSPVAGALPVAAIIIGALVGVVVYLIAFLFAQGGTVYAVSEIYLGRTTTIGASLRRMRGQVAVLFGVTLLNGLVVGAAMILLIVPGIYMACRLITCVPAALLEDLGPRDSLERSYRLTEDSAAAPSSSMCFISFFCTQQLCYLCSRSASPPV